MAIELRQQLRLSQQLVMTPQLQQAIKLLQLNRQELTSLIEQELQENPVLEESEGDDRTAGEASDETPGEDRESRAEAEANAETAAAEAETAEARADAEGAPESVASEAAAEAGSDDSPTDAEKIADIEWENYMDNYPQTGLETRVAGDDDRPSIEATLTRRPSLAEHLAWQIQLSAFDPEEVAVSRWIIGNLDDDGYLMSPVEDVARQAGADEALVERALAKVQQLDPPGVAARNLRECLMLQVQTLEIDDPLVVCDHRPPPRPAPEAGLPGPDPGHGSEPGRSLGRRERHQPARAASPDAPSAATTPSTSSRTSTSTRWRTTSTSC